MYRILIMILMLLSCFLPLTAAAEEASVPKAAKLVAEQMDQQILRRLQNVKSARASISIVSTAPVFLSNLEQSSPLARQMAEEVVTRLVEAGYRVAEIRKGKEIVMTTYGGERLLTRNLSKLAQRDVTTSAILTGTYTISRDNVRFNMKLLSTPTNEVLASSSATVPVTTEITSLLADRRVGSFGPSVYTKLR